MTTKKSPLEIKLLYNQLCFLLNLIIPKIDELEDTTVYRQDVKFHANRLREKLIPLADEHQLAYINYGNVKNLEKDISANDVFNITDKAYEEALDWFFKRPPSQVVTLMTEIKRLEAENPNHMNEIYTEYTPLDNDLKNQKYEKMGH